MRIARALSLCMLAASACGSPEAPTTGAIRVTAATTGPLRTPVVYQVSIDGGPPMPMQANASIVVDTVAHGSHSIELTGIASNCTIDGANPVTVTVTSGSTANVNFGVTCVANGAIRVVVSTDGAAAPATYTVGVDSGATGYLQSASVPANGTASITLPNGPHKVRLVTPLNCTVTSPNDVAVTTVSAASINVSFSVACVDGGTLRVTAATTGPGAPASYTVGVDSGSTGYRFSSEVPANGSVSIALSTGPHTVKLVVPANCTVTGPGNVSVTTAFGVTGSTDFIVTCAAIPPDGTLRVTAATSGSGAPSTYIVRAVGSTGSQLSATIPANGTVSLTLPPGGHTVTLVVPLNCAVTSSNDVPVTAAAGAMINLNFLVTCAASGTVRVTVGTTGVNPDGAYQLSIDGGAQTQSVTNGSIVLASIAAGDHSIALLDVAPNCTVSGPNPVTLTVDAGAISDLRFWVICVGNGTIRVTAATTGPDAPETYPLGVAGQGGSSGGSVPANGTSSISVPAGTQTLTLGVPRNCTLTSPNDVAVIVGAGAITDVAFSVTCVANGSIRVKVTTTGASFGTGSFHIYIDPIITDTYITISPNGTVSRTVGPGTHRVILVLPSQGSCHVGPGETGKTASVSLDVPSGGTADVAFSVTCVVKGTLRVTVTSTGTNAPESYPLFVDPAAVSTVVPANGAASISLLPGNYTSGLTLPSNCTGRSASSVAATITAAATTDVAFTVACQ